MPMSLETENNAMENSKLMRLQAPVEEYLNERHEIKIKDKRFIQANLLICSNKNLLALAKLDLTIRDECDDYDMTGHDVKALLTTIQLEASKCLQQVVYA